MVAGMLLPCSQGDSCRYILCLQYLLSPLYGAKSLHAFKLLIRIFEILFSLDAVLLHSLCKMFGLLDSVKQAVQLKRSHDEDDRAQNHHFGEITDVQFAR